MKMRTIFLIIISIGLLSISSFAQENSGTCPAISISGPSDIVEPGKIATYSVEVENKNNFPTLQYKWSVSEGRIVSGQGTMAIEVRQPNSLVTVTVAISGLPQGCTNTASDSAIGDPPRPITKLDHFTIPLGTIAADRIEKIRKQAYSNPNAGVFLVSYFSNTSGQYVANQRLESQQKIIGQTKDLIYITNLDCQGDDNFIDVWLVPPGATPPTCQGPEELEKSAKQQSCPTISVLGPADVALPGEVVTFRAVIEGALPGDIRFRWTADGEIIAGQGTITLKVKAPKIGEPLTATIEIIGLPKGCHASGSETYLVVASAFFRYSDTVHTK